MTGPLRIFSPLITKHNALEVLELRPLDQHLIHGILRWLLLVTIAQAVFHGVKAFLRTINYLTIAAFVSFWANTSIPFVCKSSLTSPIVLTRSLSTSLLTSVVREVERKNMQMRGANGYDNLKL